MTNHIIYSSEQKAIPRVRIPIRAKITIPYLMLSTSLAVAAAYLITQLVLENVEERFRKQLFEAAKISSELIVDHERELLETQRLLANVEGLPAAILSNDAGALRALTLGIVANGRQEAVEILDLNGEHVLSIRHRLGGNPEDYEVSTGAQTLFSDLEIVKNILSRRSDTRGNKFGDLIETDSGNFLYVSGPVYDTRGNLAGAVLVGRSLEKITAEMRIKTFGQISFYDPAGRVIQSTLPFPHELPSEVAPQAVSFKDVRSETRALSTYRDLDVANISYTEILGPFEVRGDHALGVLGVALSQNAVVVASTSSRWRVFLLVVSAYFLIILVGINLANTITRPLIRLVQASVKVTQGHLDVTIAPQSNDEFIILTESFNAMVASMNRAKKELIRSYDETLEGWAKALELRDKETEGHAERVTELTVRLAQAMGIQAQALANIRRGALLHDIGKIGTPDAILHKNGPLDAGERRIIQKHPQDAYNMLQQIDFLQHALEIPHCHHEKWDGTGYPRGLRGEEIPISARIFAIVDVFDALTNDRPDRKAMPRTEVVEYLKNQSGKHFDPNIVEVFLQILDSAGSDPT